MCCPVLRTACVAFAAVMLLSPRSDLTAQIAEDKRAHIVFDLRLDRIRVFTDKHDIELEQMLFEAVGREIPPEIIVDITRVYGAIQLPPDEETGRDAHRMIYGPGDIVDPEIRDRRDDKMPDSEIRPPDGEVRQDGLSNVSFRPPGHAQENVFPVNFFIRVEFRNEAAAKAFGDEVFQNVEMEEINGKSYARLRMGAPENFTYYMVDSDTFEAGTDDYVIAADRSNLLTDGLRAAWGAMPDEAFRVAMDLESVEPFISALVEESKVGPPPTGAMMEMFNKVSTVRCSMDLESGNLITLIVTARDETQAEELRSGLDGLLALAKMFGGQPVEEISSMSPELGDLANEILQGLAATRDGNDVSIMIPRPDGFDAAIGTGMAEIEAATKELEELNRFRQVALAVHNYHSAYREFPFEAHGGMSENLSWRARVSPFVESRQQLLLDMKEPFDSSVNSAYEDKMPTVFGGDSRNANVCWIAAADATNNFEGIRDGSSNTLMLLEFPDGMPWMDPTNLTEAEAIELITGIPEGETLIAAFYDGSVFRLRSGLTAEEIRPFLTHRGQEVSDSQILMDNK